MIADSYSYYTTTYEWLNITYRELSANVAAGSLARKTRLQLVKEYSTDSHKSRIHTVVPSHLTQ